MTAGTNYIGFKIIFRVTQEFLSSIKCVWHDFTKLELNVTQVCILKAFLQCKSVILPEEKLHFEKLTKEYMTDESDGDSNVIILHKHEWRSDSK